MIARVLILLPFDVLIREGDELAVLEVRESDYSVRVHPPFHFATRPELTGGLLDGANSLSTLQTAAFSDNMLVDGRRVAATNVLILDFSKPAFDRSSLTAQAPADPDPNLVFRIANGILAKLRVYSRAYQIKELVVGRDPCRTVYLTDDGQELEEEEGKIRVRVQGAGPVGFAALTTDAIEMIAHSDNAEPYVWDQLLLDAYELLPDVGGAVVMAAAALETFIAWALDILHQERQLPPGLWNWIKVRNGDHTKEPSVKEKFDLLLRTFTGTSLKDDTKLWRCFTELRDARNSLVHEGIAIVGKSRVDASKAKELVVGADKIIKWGELLLPEARRRARTDAIGPFTRRLASRSTKVTGLQITAEAQNQAPIRVRSDEPSEP